MIVVQAFSWFYTLLTLEISKGFPQLHLGIGKKRHYPHLQQKKNAGGKLKDFSQNVKFWDAWNNTSQGANPAIMSLMQR